MRFQGNSMLTAVAAVALCIGIAPAPAAEQKVTLAIATAVLDVSQANVSSIPIFTGCWKRAGLDVTIQTTSGSTAIQALATGQVEFAYLGSANAITARAKGAPLMGVYLNLRRNFQFPVVMESSPITSIAQFKGKTIGVASYGTPSLQVVKAMIAEAGLDPNKDVSVIETGFGAQAVTALTNKSVDVWATWDSQAATAENLGVKLRRFSSPFADRLRLGAAFFVRDDLIKRDPKSIEGLLKCVAEASAMILANPEGALRAHWTVYPATKPSGVSEQDAFAQGLHIMKTRFEFTKLQPGEKWGDTPSEAVDTMIDFMKSNGAAVGDLKSADMFTNQFIPAMNSFDPAKIAEAAKAFP
jgi:NitT/TauT family transport system substrate-binding protein